MSTYQTKLTSEQLAAWTTRLRDPNSKQLRDGYCGNGFFDNNGNIEMCCIAHGQFAVSGVLSPDKKFSIFNAIGDEVKNRLVVLNDEKMLTLPQIADWLHANVLPTHIL